MVLDKIECKVTGNADRNRVAERGSLAGRQARHLTDQIVQSPLPRTVP
jgi:hypothetical protein